MEMPGIDRDVGSVAPMTMMHDAQPELDPPQRGAAVVLRLVLGSASFTACKRRMTAENHGDSTLDSKKATAAKC